MHQLYLGKVNARKKSYKFEFIHFLLPAERI